MLFCSKIRWVFIFYLIVCNHSLASFPIALFPFFLLQINNSTLWRKNCPYVRKAEQVSQGIHGQVQGRQRKLIGISNWELVFYWVSTVLLVAVTDVSRTWGGSLNKSDFDDDSDDESWMLVLAWFIGVYYYDYNITHLCFVNCIGYLCDTAKNIKNSFFLSYCMALRRSVLVISYLYYLRPWIIYGACAHTSFCLCSCLRVPEPTSLFLLWWTSEILHIENLLSSTFPHIESLFASEAHTTSRDHDKYFSVCM